MDNEAGLERFLDAQQPLYTQVLAELRTGRKQTHWIWFIFPQIAGLGRSETARKYAIASLAEAVAYAAHPVLGARLQECTALVAAQNGRSAHDIFGSPDDQKFRSCMTLFAHAASNPEIFYSALQKYFNGAADEATLVRIQ